MKQQTDHSFILVFLSFALLIAIFVQVVPIRYETNDDAAMLLIASGAYTGSPDQNLIFINVMIGWFLSTLYKLNRDIEFYTYFLIGLHIYATTVLFNRIKNLNLSRLFFYNLTALLIFFELTMLSKLQFTTTSGYLALAAITQSQSDVAKQRWIAVFAFFTAASLRFEAAILVFLISIPFIFEKKAIFSSLKIVLILLFAAAVSKILNASYYSNKTEWQDYKSYLNIRIKINDNPNDGLFSPANQHEKNDYELLLRFIPNPTAFTNSRLEEIATDIRDTTTLTKLRNISKSVFFYELNHYNKIFFIVLLSLLLLIYTHHQNIDRRNQLVILLLIYISFYLYISFNNVLKLRIFLISVLPIFFFAIPTVLKDINNGQLKIALSGLIVLCSGILLYALAITIRSVPHKTLLINEQLHLSEQYFLRSQRPVFGVAFSPENIDPFQISKRIRGHQFVYGGWLTRAPFPNHLRSYEDLLKMSMLLPKDGMDSTIVKMVQSFKDNHRLDVGYKIVLDSKHYAIIEFVRNDHLAG